MRMAILFLMKNWLINKKKENMNFDKREIVF